jgi:signal transduction histidine kinase
MSSLRVLQIEDVEDDGLLLLHELRRGGFVPFAVRVESLDGLRAALESASWDLVLSDFGLLGFDTLDALALVQERAGDLPFVIVSGSIPDVAVSAAMKAGAHDFVSKNDLKRLVPAVRRELAEARSRHERRLAEARFQTLARSLDGLVLTIDGQLVVDGVFGRGLSAGPLLVVPAVGQRVRELLGADGATIEASCRRVLAGADATVHELTFANGDELSTVQVSIAPMLAADGGVSGLVATLRDITDSKRLQAHLVSSDRMATIGTLAAGVAHEINNPLAALLSNLGLLDRHLGQLEHGRLTPGVLTDMQEMLTDARAAAAIVRTIASDLRTFSRQAEEAPSPVSVIEVLESALRLARNQIASRARISRCYDDVPAAKAVASRLGQVFLNLLVNAAQAIPDDASARDHAIGLAVSADHTARRVIIAVSDTGPGIPEKLQQRLFTPFFTTKPSGVGTGLGLSICRRIVSSFGGDITVQSAVGAGSTFRVSLPFALAS